MAVPTVPALGAGDKITSAYLASLKAAVDFIQDPPRVHVYNTAGQSFPDGATTLCVWDSEIYDWTTTGLHSGSSSVITIPESGLYDCKIHISIGAATYTTLDVMGRVNAGGVSTSGTTIRTWPVAPQGGRANLAFERRFTAGDTVEVFITQSSGATRSSSTVSLGQGMQVRWVAL